MPKFEAHITFERAHADIVRGEALAGADAAWRFSSFDADPVMGDKPFVYLTAYDADRRMLLARMRAKAAYLETIGAPPIRQKIERIIYDTKTGIDELSEM